MKFKIRNVTDFEIKTLNIIYLLTTTDKVGADKILDNTLNPDLF